MMSAFLRVPRRRGGRFLYIRTGYPCLTKHVFFALVGDVFYFPFFSICMNLGANEMFNPYFGPRETFLFVQACIYCDVFFGSSAPHLATRNESRSGINRKIIGKS